MLSKMCSICLVFCFVSTIKAADLEVLTISNDSIHVDGTLTEPAWKKAKSSGAFIRRTQSRNQTNPQNTTFKILVDEKGIYLGFTCDENDMRSLKANIKNDSKRVWEDDVLEIFFCPTGKNDIFYQFVLAAGGARWSQYSAEKGAVKLSKYRPYWKTAVFKGKSFWSAEVMIPWGAFYMTGAKMCANEWLMNVARQRPRMGYDISSWSKLKYALNETRLFNKVTGFPSKPSKYDAFIKSAAASVDLKKNDCYVGKIDLVVHPSGAVGEYRLKLNIDGDNYEKTVLLKKRTAITTINDVVYKKTGKSWVSMELFAPDGELVNGRCSLIDVQYAPIVWRMRKPLYKKCYFPGQDATRIVGAVKLNIPLAHLESTSVKVTVIPDSLPPQTGIFNVVGGVAEFKFKLKSEKYSNAVIKVDAISKGVVLCSSSMSIRNLPPKKGMANLYVENRMLYVNQLPKFLMFFWGARWCVGSAFLELHPNLEDLFSAIEPESYNIVNLQMRRLMPKVKIEEKEGRLDIKPCAELLRLVRDKVLKNRDRTDFWFYYLEDEPECRSLSPIYLRHLYELVTELDPYHPVYIISRDPVRFIGCADILSAHCYTQPMEEDGQFWLGNTGYSFRSHVAAFNNIRPMDTSLNFSPQMFSYGFINNCSVYPRFDDSRATIWSSVCNGAMGVTPYTFNGYSASAELEYGYNFIFESISSLEPFLVRGETLPVSVTNKGIVADVMLKKYDGKRLLIVVNVMNKPTKATVSGNALKNVSTLQVFRESRKLNLKNGELRLNLAPFEVMLLTSAKEDCSLTSLETLRKTLAAEKKKIKDRGNILSGYRRMVELSSSPMRWSGNPNLMIESTLFDGDLDSPGLIALPANHNDSGWFEISFTKKIPKFSKLVLHHANINHLKMKILKYGEWQEPKVEKRTETKHKTKLDFGKTLSTVKIRLEFDKLKRATQVYYEIYELELFK